MIHFGSVAAFSPFVNQSLFYLKERKLFLYVISIFQFVFIWWFLKKNQLLGKKIVTKIYISYTRGIVEMK